LRETLEGLGIETHVLARPTKKAFAHPSRVDNPDVWDQERVTVASNYDIPLAEYLDWLDSAGLDVMLVDQNYQFQILRNLRERGVTTIGRFVWEAFNRSHVPWAKEALSVIYSFTNAERDRYRSFGIDSPLVPFGCHPELLDYQTTDQGHGNYVRFFYPGGFHSRRKPTGAVIKAFSRVGSELARLTIKGQRPLRQRDLVILDGGEWPTGQTLQYHVNNGDVGALSDDRVTIVSDDLPMSSYYGLFSSHDVCLAPSRWEGLGLHLYEATAFGLPIISNDIQPVNEVVVDQDNGCLCRSTELRATSSGVRAYEPLVDSLAECIDAMTNAVARSKAARGAKRRRAELTWDNTRDALATILGVHGCS
jgi:glycosyltransferase involved in cell wall biosynthesis